MVMPSTTGMAVAGFRSAAVFYYAGRLMADGATVADVNAALRACRDRPLAEPQVTYLAACGVYPAPDGQQVLFR